jgi:3-hydroxyisobutyrate dehydrogenase-like beta-hydroxyacid dehydrogenase
MNSTGCDVIIVMVGYNHQVRQVVSDPRQGRQEERRHRDYCNQSSQHSSGMRGNEVQQIS